MFDNKKVKKAARERQDRTGETYSTARMQVLQRGALAKGGSPEGAPPTPPASPLIRVQAPILGVRQNQGSVWGKDAHYVAFSHILTGNLYLERILLRVPAGVKPSARSLYPENPMRFLLGPSSQQKSPAPWDEEENAFVLFQSPDPRLFFADQEITLKLGPADAPFPEGEYVLILDGQGPNPDPNAIQTWMEAMLQGANFITPDELDPALA